MAVKIGERLLLLEAPGDRLVQLGISESETVRVLEAARSVANGRVARGGSRATEIDVITASAIVDTVPVRTDFPPAGPSATGEPQRRVGSVG